MFRRRRGAVLLLALAAFWLAQTLAFAHASRHLGNDGTGLPGHHAALCTDCASLLPLLVVAGPGGAAFALSRPAPHASPRQPAPVAFATASHRAFRSRAPPR